MDVSRNMLAVLLVLVIVVSGLGTLTLLGEDSQLQTPSMDEPANGGEVALVVQQIPRGQGVVALDVSSDGGPSRG